MIDLYSEVYDRFFRHDYKLKKSVPTVLINILARNFMDAYIYMELGCKTVGTKKTQEHKATQIAFTDKGIESTALTYTIQPDPISKDNEKKEEKKKEEIPAHSEIFLHQFRSILEYRKGNGNNWYKVSKGQKTFVISWNDCILHLIIQWALIGMKQRII